MQIEVTETDIKEGIIKDCKRCPIANAISKAISDGIVVKVRYTMVDFMTIEGRRYWRKLPELATKFISDYDLGYPVVPFTFDLNLPEELLKCPPSSPPNSPVASKPA